MGSAHLPRSRRPVDHYQLLGVAADATLREIEQAYWQAAKEHRELLPQLNNAYEVLGHADRRQAYDKQRIVVTCPADANKFTGARSERRP